ncbi:DNA replication complex GINS family protein [Candidatus Woesearchaeota archaeon]|nr:DNA replication complex GINS family protein [Candidatus Woesearchaeota archaeon]
MAAAITLTFETLFELVRREKTRDELQELPEGFYGLVIQYLKEKQGIQEKTGADARKSPAEIENVKRIIAELYDRREKKIVGLAMNKARTGSKSFDSKAMLDEEVALYRRVIDSLAAFRSGVLANVLSQKSPSQPPALPSPATAAGTSSDAATSGMVPAEDSLNAMVRILQPIPKFVGPDLAVYGPFVEEDVANLPREVAELLVSKGRAEKMKGK